MNDRHAGLLYWRVWCSWDGWDGDTNPDGRLWEWAPEIVIADGW